MFQRDLLAFKDLFLGATGQEKRNCFTRRSFQYPSIEAASPQRDKRAFEIDVSILLEYIGLFTG